MSIIRCREKKTGIFIYIRACGSHSANKLNFTSIKSLRPFHSVTSITPLKKWPGPST